MHREIVLVSVQFMKRQKIGLKKTIFRIFRQLLAKMSLGSMVNTMNKKFKNIVSIISLLFSFISLIISILTLHTNRHRYGYDINENLSINITIEDVEILEIIRGEDYSNNNYSSYLAHASVCFVNNSNLPIYIEWQNFYFYDGYYSRACLKNPFV